MSKYRGPLGAPRLTNVGPLVNKEQGYSQPQVNEEDAKQLAREVFAQNNLPSEGLSDDEAEIVAEAMAQEVYPGDDKITTAKRTRLKNCIAGTWAKDWTAGIQRKAQIEDVDAFEDEKERMALILRGCIGMTEYITTDNEALLPDVLPDIPRDEGGLPDIPRGQGGLPDIVRSEDGSINIVQTVKRLLK